MKKLFLAAVVLAIPCNVEAFFENGNQLLARCQDNDSFFSKGVCNGYVVGVFEAMTVHGYKCDLPKGVTNGQLVDIAIEYLRKNPKMRHHESVYLVSSALIDAFACVSGK